jgi:diacylglycerol kinase family enzyme
MAQAMTAEQPFAVRLTSERHERTLKTRVLVVSNNIYSNAPLRGLTRQRLDGGVLGVYAEHGTGPLGSVRWAAAALAGLFEQGPGLLSGEARELTLHFDTDTLPATVDGEPERFASPVRITTQPQSLAVLAPGGEGNGR